MKKKTLFVVGQESSGLNIKTWLGTVYAIVSTPCYVTIRPVALSGYGSIAHGVKPNGLLIRGP